MTPGGMTLVGIDPGEAHTGIASIEIRGRMTIWRTGVIQNAEDYLRPVFVLDELFGCLRAPVFAIEDYHVRPVGHQAYTRAVTTRLIGAIEFLTRLADRPLHFYPPGNIARDLDRFGLTDILDRWEPNWPPAVSTSSWEHARSAWRILAYYILHERPELSFLFDSSIMQPRSWSAVDQWKGVMITHDVPMWAPAMILRRTDDE